MRDQFKDKLQQSFSDEVHFDLSLPCAIAALSSVLPGLLNDSHDPKLLAHTSKYP